VPLYQQIVVNLSGRITGGEWAPGALLPGEHELAGSFGVSRITAKRALDELADAGLVRRERGRGTRVLSRPGPVAMHASVDGWLETMGRMQRDTAARVLQFGYVAAPEPVAAALGLLPGAEVQRSVRVRSLAEGPLSYLVCYLPAGIGRTFAETDLERTGMLQLLERAGARPASARQQIGATLAAPDVAQALGIHAGAALLEVRRVVEDAEGRPVQYLRALYRPELYRIEMAMTRTAGEDGLAWTATPAEAAE
jgi:GntR family transcriptional regulator